MNPYKVAWNSRVHTNKIATKSYFMCRVSARQKARVVVRVFRGKYVEVRILDSNGGRDRFLTWEWANEGHAWNYIRWLQQNFHEWKQGKPSEIFD